MHRLGGTKPMPGYVAGPKLNESYCVLPPADSCRYADHFSGIRLQKSITLSVYQVTVVSSTLSDCGSYNDLLSFRRLHD